MRIINQSILSSALKVARKKLGFAEGRDPELMARIKPEVSESHSVKELMASGLLQHVLLSNAEIESKFTGSNGSGLDPEVRMPQRLVANPRRFSAFRTGFLLFTLFFIGWHAQGQLSIVNLTGVLHALIAGRGLGFLIYDPMTVSLSAFIGLSLLIWGRGTFCGWLCPFGALQEFTARIGKLFKIAPTRFRPETDRRLKWIKYRSRPPSP